MLTASRRFDTKPIEDHLGHLVFVKQATGFQAFSIAHKSVIGMEREMGTEMGIGMAMDMGEA